MKKDLESTWIGANMKYASRGVLLLMHTPSKLNEFEFVKNTWMRSSLGVGELGSECQGWSGDSCFSQETVAKVQYWSRNDLIPSLLEIAQDARQVSGSSSPSFFSSQHKAIPLGGVA